MISVLWMRKLRAHEVKKMGPKRPSSWAERCRLDWGTLSKLHSLAPPHLGVQGTRVRIQCRCGGYTTEHYYWPETCAFQQVENEVTFFWLLSCPSISLRQSWCLKEEYDHGQMLLGHHMWFPNKQVSGFSWDLCSKDCLNKLTN